MGSDGKPGGNAVAIISELTSSGDKGCNGSGQADCIPIPCGDDGTCWVGFCTVM